MSLLKHIWPAFSRCQCSLSTLSRFIYNEGVHPSVNLAPLAGYNLQSSRRGSSKTVHPTCRLVETERNVGFTKGQQIQKIKKKPVSPPDARVLKVAIIGAPNAGKSTIANKLLGWRFAAVSEKVHTTRLKTLGILTDENTQVIFLDTPGMITTPKMKKHSLERTLLTDPHSSLFEADMILVVVDVSTPWGSTGLDKEVLKALHLHKDKRSVLVLNKIDKLRVKKYLLQATRQLTNGLVGGRKDSFTRKERTKDLDIESLLTQNEHSPFSKEGDSQNDDSLEWEALGKSSKHAADFKDNRAWVQYDGALRKIEKKIDGENIRGWPHFDRVFMLIAKDGDGVWDLKRYLINEAQPSEWQYDQSLVTTQMPMEIAKQCIWEKCMDYLPNDIPYKLEVRNEMWVVDDNGMLRAVFAIVCSRSRQMKAVLGKEGETVKKIASEAKQALLDTFRHDMSLKVYAKLKSDR